MPAKANDFGGRLGILKGQKIAGKWDHTEI